MAATRAVTTATAAQAMGVKRFEMRRAEMDTTAALPRAAAAVAESKGSSTSDGGGNVVGIDGGGDGANGVGGGGKYGSNLATLAS